MQNFNRVFLSSLVALGATASLMGGLSLVHAAGPGDPCATNSDCTDPSAPNCLPVDPNNLAAGTSCQAGGGRNTESFQKVPLLQGTKDVGGASGFNTERTIPVVVGTIVQWVLGLVGIIALVFFIAGGFQYLTSQGNEEQVTAAKNRMIYAVIGLVIIAIAWVATAYVVGLFEAARNTALS